MLSLLKPTEVAHRLGVSRAWVYDAAKQGRIPSIRIGGEEGPCGSCPRILICGSTTPARHGHRVGLPS